MKQHQFHTSKGYQDLHLEGSDLTPAMEDYLEMVGRLCQTDGYTRTGTLSDALNVKPSSASKMITKLTHLDYLVLDHNKGVHLTKKGYIEFSYLIKRHNTIEQFLNFLGSPDALKETELIEHMLSSTTVSNIRHLLHFFEENTQIKVSYQTLIEADDLL